MVDIAEGGRSVNGVIQGYASFGRRFAAWMLDTLLVLVVIEVVNAGAGELVPGAWSAGPGVLTTGTVVALAAQLAYLVWFTGRGATPGKMVLGIRVVDAEGSPPGMVRAATRSLIFLASSIALLAANASVAGSDSETMEPGGGALFIFGVVVLVNLYDHLSMLWNTEHQTLHDRIAGTWVVRSPR
jgi:uncharacterized RDD family membrane protein YckC